MSVALTNLSWWLRSSKQKQHTKPINGTSSLNTTGGEIHLLETNRFPLVIGGGERRTSSTPRRLKKKLQTRQEQTIDREHDVVLVSSDGGCISDSDSDASDWSVGWSEPHPPGFLQSDDEDENDGGFSVLVPCYGRRIVDQRGGLGLNNTTVDAKLDHYSRDNQKYMEQWLRNV